VKSVRHTIFALLRTAVGIGLLVYLGLSGAIQWQSLWGLLLRWRVTLAALVLLWVDVVLMAWRLAVLLKPCGFYLSIRSALRLTLIGIFFNSFLPGSTGGDVIKVFYAAQGNRGRRTEVATVILLARAVGMFALLLLPLLLAPLFPQLIRSMPVLRDLLRLAALLALLMLAGLLVCFSSRVRNSLLLTWIFQKLPGGAYLETVLDTVHRYRRSFGTLVAVLIISLVTHVFATGITLLAGQATNPAGFAWDMVELIPLGHLANTLPLTPGGLGVGEAAFEALYAQAGFSGGAETLLGWRLLSLVIGLVGLGYYLQGRRQFVEAADQPATAVSRD
jgi:uncharacterized protein (TIRG00374 family)